jgi:hypothetical protein
MTYMPRVKLESFEDTNKENWLRFVSDEAGTRLSKSLLVVAKRVIEIPDICCVITLKDELVSLENFARRWTNKFLDGYENRPSKRISNPIGTLHDTILDEIITARINITSSELQSIKYGHRLSMSAENIAGTLLEEYLANKLLNYQWHCCWGETMRSIDFCNENGDLIQIKNSDNSENSSSKAVRDGTVIKHWFRRFSRTGKTNWEALNQLVNIKKIDDLFTENSFKDFVKNAVLNNPGSVFIERDSPYWNNQRNNDN